MFRSRVLKNSLKFTNISKQPVFLSRSLTKKEDFFSVHRALIYVVINENKKMDMDFDVVKIFGFKNSV